jgi:glycosyltransferase involved in cell wall biosynthesis
VKEETNILHIAPAFHSQGGGIFEVVDNLSNAQGDIKNTLVHVLCTSACDIHSSENRTVHNLLPTSFGQLFLLFPLLKWIFNQIRSMTHIHIHGAWSFQFLFLVPLVFIFNKKITYQPHGLLSPVCMQKSWFVKKIAWFVYQHYYLLFSKNVICCSDKERQELMFLSNNSKKLSIVSNGLHKSFFETKPKSASRKNKLLFFSQITPIKNLENVFHALAMRKELDGVDHRIDIYGYGPSDYIDSLKKLGSQLGLKENVEFLGPIAREKRVDVYDDYKYFILPSLSENFGIVVLEALSRRCQVLVSSQTPWRDFEYSDLTVFDPDKDSIYQALKATMSSDVEIFNPQRDIDWQGLNDRFQWDGVAKKINSIYIS